MAYDDVDKTPAAARRGSIVGAAMRPAQPAAAERREEREERGEEPLREPTELPAARRAA